MNRIDQTFAAIFAANRAAPEYKIDAQGNKVRIFSTLAPLSKEIVRDFLLDGKRAVEKEEALERIGENGFRYMVKVGQLKADPISKGRFFITKLAAEAYNLPRPVIAGTVADFIA